MSNCFDFTAANPREVSLLEEAVGLTDDACGLKTPTPSGSIRDSYRDASIPICRKEAFDMNARKFRIEGRVQGVWFRESTRQQAVPLGITGYARNMPDGTVEILACGDENALNQLAEWLESGPPMARVSNVEWSEVKADCPDTFYTG